MANLSNWIGVQEPTTKVLVIHGSAVMITDVGKPQVIISGDDHKELIALAHHIEDYLVQKRYERLGNRIDTR